MITCLGYLLAVTVPCPPDPMQLAAAGAKSVASHQHNAATDGSTSIDAPCACGCDKTSGAGGTAKRLGPVLLPDAPAFVALVAQPPPGAALVWPRAIPDPIDPPIPIPA